MAAAAMRTRGGPISPSIALPAAAAAVDVDWLMTARRENAFFRPSGSTSAGMNVLWAVVKTTSATPMRTAATTSNGPASQPARYAVARPASTRQRERAAIRIAYRRFRLRSMAIPMGIPNSRKADRPMAFRMPTNSVPKPNVATARMGRTVRVSASPKPSAAPVPRRKRKERPGALSACTFAASENSRVVMVVRRSPIVR